MPRKWVLVVDDDSSILTVVEEAIEHPELSVTTAGDARQAVIQARELKPIVIVTDISMPGQDGSLILKLLRREPGMLKCPVIFMTGMALEVARELLPQDDPSISLISKPLKLEMLRDRVWALAGIAPAAPPFGGRP